MSLYRLTFSLLIATEITMPTLFKLLEKNREWAERIQSDNPDFFKDLSEQQRPKYLWIGCSDSRVPANQIIDLMPGEVFVHRNIANLVVHTDLNMLSVLHYAVSILEVEHIMVVGHYGCGGVRTAMERENHGIIDCWLRHIQDVAMLNTDELTPLDEEARLDRLCELNVIAQTDNLRRTSVMQEAWEKGKKIEIHTWIYSLKDGLVRPLRDVITS